MKIIYLHQYFNTPDMSGGTRSYEMARRLVAKGHEVHMVTSWRDESDKQDWYTTLEAGIHVHWLPVAYSNNLSYKDRIVAFFKFAWQARKKAVELNGDVIFATSTPLTIALPAVFASRKKKLPMVFEVRDLWPELPIAIGALNNPILQWGAKKLERWAYFNSNAVIALSPGMKEGVINTGYPIDQVAVIPNSSDNTEFAYDQQAGELFRAKRPWLRNRPLLVYTGTFGKINGVSYLVDLAVALRNINPDICILMIGHGLEKPLIIEKAKKTNVWQENLFVEDSIPKKEIPGLLSAAQMASALFVDMPEMRPNSANKFFDALASGTPVMINYGGWMHDLVLKHECGLAMWQQSIDTVAQEVASKITDKKWLELAGIKARELAEYEFDRDVLANQLEKVLLSVKQGNSKSVETISPGNY